MLLRLGCGAVALWCGLSLGSRRASAQSTAETVVSYTEVARKEVELPDQRLTLIKIQPPILPKAPPPAPPPALTADEQAFAERRSKKTYGFVTFAVTVYIGPTLISELRWEKDGMKYLAFSNADFRLLTEPRDFEDEASVYAWFPFVYTEDLTATPATLAALMNQAAAEGLAPADKAIHFVPAGSARQLSVDDPALRALDSIHAFYQLNYTDLLQRYNARLADEVAKELVAALPKPKPEVRIYFWPVEGRKAP